MLLAERKPGTQAPDGGASYEEELWTRFRQCPQDGAALSRLMEHYLPLATQTVRRLSIRFAHRFEPADLIGAAILGLHAAIQRFSPDHGVPFSAYARKRITGAVLDDLRQRDPLTRDQRSRLRKVQAALQDFGQLHGRSPSNEELADELGMSAGQVAESLALGYHTVSLDEELEDGLTYGDTLADPNMPSPLESAELQSARRALRKALPQLDVRDQQLLFFRHSQALTIAEIAAVFEVTPARVSQMYNHAILRLRSLMKVGATA
jgi:RNA polymerase sigma factor for flagellar operon FliA